jgi:hypothetical protein
LPAIKQLSERRGGLGSPASIEHREQPKNGLSLARLHIAGFPGVAGGPSHSPVAEPSLVSVSSEEKKQLERIDEADMLELGGGGVVLPRSRAWRKR